MKTTEQRNVKITRITLIGLISLVILMASGGILFAQPQDRMREMPPVPNSKQINEMVSQLSKAVSLNKEQEVKVLALYQKHFNMVKKAFSAGHPDRSKMENLKSLLEKQLKEVFTPKQQKQYAVFQQKQAKKMHGRPPR